MTAAPEITCEAAKKAYLQAVYQITGIWQMEVSRMHAAGGNEHIAKMWPLTFTAQQQEDIMVRFVVLRLETT